MFPCCLGPAARCSKSLILSAFGALGAVLGLSWPLLGALETLLGAILSDLGSLQHVLKCSWEEIWSKDGPYVVFLVIFTEIYNLRTLIFAIPYTVFNGFSLLGKFVCKMLSECL